MIAFFTPLSVWAQDGYVRPTAAVVATVVFGVAFIATVVACILLSIRYQRIKTSTLEGESDPALPGLRRSLVTTAIVGIILLIAFYFAWQWRVFRGSIPSPIATSGLALTEQGVVDIVENQYPAVDATKVPRNASIFIWFTQSMDRTTLIDDHQTSTLADDTVESANVRVWQGLPSEALAKEGTFLALKARSDGLNRVFAFDPPEPFGSATKEEVYTVELRNIRLKDGRNAFGSDGYYRWSFTTARTMDTTGPESVHFFPNTPQRPAPLNTGIQIEWNERIDPLSFASGITVAHGTQEVSGTWSIASGELLGEFFSHNICGLNLCRNEVMCLPASATLVVNARTVDPTVYPLLGIRDLQGNLVRAETGSLGSFTTGTALEQSTPTLTAVEPRQNSSNISPSVPVKAVFSKILRANSITHSTVRLEGDGRWTARVSTDFDKQFSTITIQHETLLPEAVVSSIVSSEIQDIYQNCFAQCKGPL